MVAGFVSESPAGFNRNPQCDEYPKCVALCVNIGAFPRIGQGGVTRATLYSTSTDHEFFGLVCDGLDPSSDADALKEMIGFAGKLLRHPPNSAGNASAIANFEYCTWTV